MMGTLRVMIEDVVGSLLELALVVMTIFILFIVLLVSAAGFYLMASHVGGWFLFPVVAAIVVAGWAWISSARRRVQNTNQGE